VILILLRKIEDRMNETQVEKEEEEKKNPRWMWNKKL